MATDEFGEDNMQNMEFGSEFESGGQDGFNLDLDAGEHSPNDNGNNPLGLSDKDLQLEVPFDEHYQATSSGTFASEKTTDHDDALDRPESPIDDAEAGGKSPGGDGTALDANDLFGSDHSDAEEDGPTAPTGNDGEAEDVNNQIGDEGLEASNAQPQQDDDNLSEGGSIKSDAGDQKLSDFDIMMQKKSEERKRAYKRRKKQDVDLINDHDDRIKVLIDEMKEAAEADRRSNQRGECAISKLTMLGRIMNLLRKHDLQTALLDLGILSALADWLAPLPDGNLPHLKIRESILKVLQEMSSVTPEQLKNSGIGKAVMLLFKHPREMKENRAAAGKLIQEWSRPIFGTSANYRSLSREEREERDMELLQVKRRQSGEGRASSGQKRRKDASDEEEEEEEEDPNLQIPRARVPQPSLKDYVIRPKSQFQMEPNEGNRRSGGTKPQNRFAKKIRGLQEQQRTGGQSKNKNLSLEGRRM